MGKIKVHAWDILRMIPDEEIAKIAKDTEIRKSHPLAGPTIPVAWASTAHQVGIHRTSAGQQVPVLRAMNAHTLGD